MNRAAMIEQLKQTQEMIAKLLALLEAGEADKFAAHLYQSRRHYRRTCERPNKGDKAIKRTFISSSPRGGCWISSARQHPLHEFEHCRSCSCEENSSPHRFQRPGAQLP
jgi:hypothetical protein